MSEAQIVVIRDLLLGEKTQKQRRVSNRDCC